ncbi:MAG: hypothetical protein KAI47_16480, partial [Deltaproteobacteria bacterium]|nr:hypothetical protein [Deltaproteobacteria bacterium]
MSDGQIADRDGTRDVFRRDSLRVDALLDTAQPVDRGLDTAQPIDRGLDTTPPVDRGLDASPIADMNPCAQNPCDIHATCTPTGSAPGYTCACQTGYAGDGTTCHVVGPVAAGDLHTCAIRADGSLFCWGNNGQGELGLGNRTTQMAPTRVGTGTSWMDVDAGRSFTCGLYDDGRLFCWGRNEHSQLAQGDIVRRLVP